MNAIFTELARRAAMNMGEYPQAFERYMRLALKAQSQCRTTLEALATIKNPPVVYARQANISAGPQQVNNGIMAQPLPRAGNAESAPNELLMLEARNDQAQRVDSGTASQAGGGDQALAAIGEVDRPVQP